MNDIKLTVDAKAVDSLGPYLHAAEEVGLRGVLERGQQLLREEVPKKTHNLEQGISSHIEPGMLEGSLIVSDRSGRRGSNTAIVHLASGKTKTVSLRPQPAHDYAEDVARGTGIYGPNAASIVPAVGKALLVPVSSVPTLNGKPEEYLEIDGQKFIVRKSVRGTKPNPYDERAGQRLDAEAPAIFEKGLEIFQGNSQP
jgi:hypothetical protein